MVRAISIDPPLPRLEFYETFHNVARLFDKVSANPCGDVHTLLVIWQDGVLQSVVYHLRGLGYAPLPDKTDTVAVNVGVSWKAFRRGGAS